MKNKVISGMIQKVEDNNNLNGKEFLVTLNSQKRKPRKKKTSKLDILIKEFREFRKEVNIRLAKIEERFDKHGEIFARNNLR